MGLAVGQPVRKKEIEVRWRAGGPPPPTHGHYSEACGTARIQYKTNTRTTPQSHYHPRKYSRELW
jgi:hypothetical protein